MNEKHLNWELIKIMLTFRISHFPTSVCRVPKWMPNLNIYTESEHKKNKLSCYKVSLLQILKNTK